MCITVPCWGGHKEVQRTCLAPWHAYARFNPLLPAAGRASANLYPHAPASPGAHPSSVSPPPPADPNPNAEPGGARLPPGGGRRGGAGGRTPRTSPSEPRWQSTSSAGSWCPCPGVTRPGRGVGGAGTEPCPEHGREGGQTQPCPPWLQQAPMPAQCPGGARRWARGRADDGLGGLRSHRALYPPAGPPASPARWQPGREHRARPCPAVLGWEPAPTRSPSSPSSHSSSSSCPHTGLGNPRAHPPAPRARQSLGVDPPPAPSGLGVEEPGGLGSLAAQPATPCTDPASVSLQHPLPTPSPKWQCLHVVGVGVPCPSASPPGTPPRLSPSQGPEDICRDPPTRVPSPKGAWLMHCAGGTVLPRGTPQHRTHRHGPGHPHPTTGLAQGRGMGCTPPCSCPRDPTSPLHPSG